MNLSYIKGIFRQKSTSDRSYVRRSGRNHSDISSKVLEVRVKSLDVSPERSAPKILEVRYIEDLDIRFTERMPHSIKHSISRTHDQPNLHEVSANCKFHCWVWSLARLNKDIRNDFRSVTKSGVYCVMPIYSTITR